MRDDVVERLLSLFAPSDRAEALAGDLVEEREQRGWVWYWLHVVTLTFALWRNATMDAPLRMLALTLAAGVLFSAPAFAGAAAILLFPLAIGSLPSWLALAFFWWGGALLIGASLAVMAPRQGMATCALVAAVGAALLIGVGVIVDPQELSRPLGRMFFVIALGTTVALLAGGAIARRRTIVIAVPFAGIVGVAAVVVFVMGAASSSSARHSEWRDPSPHAVQLVDVDTAVQLEVLDWGGSGPNLLLLAGGGDTAHVFDDVAPVLARRYRVVGITRRGHPGSSAPATGYGFARLADDVVRAMEAVDLETPVVVGHSLAGEEMHVLGARHASRIAGLVYVDAAFDRGDDADNDAYDAVARTLPAAPGPGVEDMASFTTLRAFLGRVQGGTEPEARLRARYIEGPDGMVRRWAPEPHVFQAMAAELRAAYSPYVPERISVPALAIYAVPTSTDDLMRRGSSDRLPLSQAAITAASADPAVRERFESLYRLTRARVQKHRAWFEAFAERARVAEISGTHDLFISNPSAVLEHIDAFVASLGDGPTAAPARSSR